MKKMLITLVVFAAVAASPAHAINEKYRAQLERSGCTQVTEADGTCDIHKTKAQNASHNHQTSSHGKINYSPFVGNWKWQDGSGKLIDVITVTGTSAKIGGRLVEEPSVHDGALYFKVGVVNFTLLKGGNGNWVSPSASGSLERK